MTTYRFRPRFCLALAALVCLSAQPAYAAAPTRPTVQLVPAAKLKIPAARRHASPDRRATLIESTDVRGGDFPEAAVYLHAGGKVYNLGWYRRVGKVKWSSDSKTVTFEGAQLEDYGVDDVVKVTYVLGASTMTRTVLRKERDEPTG